MSCNSASVGFWPKDRITVANSFVVIVPSPSLSKSSKASLNSLICSSVKSLASGRFFRLLSANLFILALGFWGRILSNLVLLHRHEGLLGIDRGSGLVAKHVLTFLCTSYLSNPLEVPLLSPIPRDLKRQKSLTRWPAYLFSQIRYRRGAALAKVPRGLPM